jgi:hypothetical protein
MNRKAKALGAAALSAAMLAAMPQVSDAASTSKRLGGLNGPRGISINATGKMVVGQADGSVVRIFRVGDRRGEIKTIGRVPVDSEGGLAPAVAQGPDNTVFALTAGGVEAGHSTLYRFKDGKRTVVRDIAAYQAKDPDPYDLEAEPTESNPFGLAALPNGATLVADAAGNDLLKVRPGGKMFTVARVKPRMVAASIPQETLRTTGRTSLLDQTLRGVPQTEMMPSEAVITSVTVGADGAYYIGELRGFPGTPGTSYIWRIKPGAHDAVCDPAHPRRGDCRVYVDGLTSIVALAAGQNGSIYATELSKLGWMAMESMDPAAMTGAVIRIYPDRTRRKELRPGLLTLPGGVAVGRKGGVYATTPTFSFVGPGRI